jgi:hypothetical protein
MPVDEELRRLVVLRANNRCEYCLIRQDDDAVFRFPIDRIISGQHGGQYTHENTALACHHCNKKKGPNIASVSPDLPRSIVPLFNPRSDVWAEHFEYRGHVIVGITPVGKATVELLDMNAPAKLRLRSLTGYPKTEPKQ